MNTLTKIEAERVNQIMEHAIKRLDILSYIPTTWDDDLVVDVKCPPILSSLEKLWMGEEQIKDIDMSMGANGAKDITLLKQVHRQTLTVCRNLMSDPPTLDILKSRPETRAEEVMKFIAYLNELQKLVSEKLTTTVEDETAQRTQFQVLTEQERTLEENKEIIQTKLNELREQRELECTALDNTLRKLRHELQEVTLVSEIIYFNNNDLIWTLSLLLSMC
jgi:hypothetical protein